MTACRSCGQEIIFVRSQKTGKMMPLSARPSDRGNVVIRRERAIVLAGEQLVEAQIDQQPLFRSHFADCPFAHRHRT